MPSFFDPPANVKAKRDAARGKRCKMCKCHGEHHTIGIVINRCRCGKCPGFKPSL